MEIVYYMSKTIKEATISVIIPLYNAEKYIEQCLGSILDQTFQDYEVIVVDDCSTDNSVKVVEKIAPRFKGRLRLVKRDNNSGAAAIPRNIGLRLARGKYIAFTDNDDMFTRNAFEDMFNVAEKTQADIIHAEKWLIPTNGGSEIGDSTPLRITTYEKVNFVDKPTVETENLSERLKMFCEEKIFWHIWTNLYRREFLAENYIEFPNMIIADDMMFWFFCICSAKKIVRVPDIFNIYRYRKDSFSNDRNSVERIIHNWVTVMIDGTKVLDKFMDEVKFFTQHPEFKYMVLDYFVQKHLSYTASVYAQVPSYQFYDVVKKEFSLNPAENATLTTHLYNIAEMYRLNLMSKNNQILQLQQQIANLQK